MAIMSSRATSARPAGRRWTRPRSAVGALAAAVVGLSLLVSGCGGSPSAGVAQLPSTTTTSTDGASPGGSTTGSTSGSPAAYSACMRKNGVPKFPDPDKNGGLLLRAGPGTGIQPDSAQFKAAERKCRSLQPKGRAPSPQAQARQVQQMLDFSRCMRSHGVPGFPDPEVSADGGISLSIRKGSGLDPNSSRFQAAQRACQKLMPGPKGGPAGPMPSGKSVAP
jgi:hypothetical protein